VDDFLRDGDTLTAADLRNRKTHEANHNTRDVSENTAEFCASQRYRPMHSLELWSTRA
jgi:hypothetical protein